MNGKMVENGSLVSFGSANTQVHIESLAYPAKILMMAGRPIDEPIAHYGPFVMNTQEEIMEAFRDLNAGKMGMIDI